MWVNTLDFAFASSVNYQELKAIKDPKAEKEKNKA
jgi:hypothetical protein